MIEHPNSDSALVIKIGDLLHNPWSKDTIIISDYHINTSYTSIRAEILIASISEYEIVVQILSMTRKQSTMCDYCGQDLVIDKHTDDQMFMYVLEQEQEEADVTGDPTFPIEKDRTIDLWLILHDTVLLYNDVQHVCGSCEERLSRVSAVDFGDNDRDRPQKGNMIFISKNPEQHTE